MVYWFAHCFDKAEDTVQIGICLIASGSLRANLLINLYVNYS